MPLFDLRGDELRGHVTATVAPAGLADFWTRTLAESRAVATPPRAVRVDTGLTLVETWDVTFSGFGGHPVRAWWHRPTGADAVPAVVHYQGYGGGRGRPHRVAPWVLAGLGCLEVDTRGQGSGYAPGDTPDPVGSDPAHPGFLTKGIADPDTYYYRRLHTDSVLAVDALAGLPGADPSRVAVAGGSQGGALALAVAGLRDDLAGAAVDVPFLCDVRRASEVSPTAPYTELAGYLAVHPGHVDRVFATLAHVDGAVLAATATAPALFSVGLVDEVCPPSTVYAAFNAYGGPKEIREYPYNGHEGGGADHEALVLDRLREWLLR